MMRVLAGEARLSHPAQPGQDHRVRPGRITDGQEGMWRVLTDMREHQAVQLHPIMYVADQYAERSFYELFGFQRVYEGDEFPGFLAIRTGKRSLDFSARRPNYRATR